MTFDPERYAALLAATRPAVIEDLDEHERMLSVAESLMDKGDALTPEEEKLLALIVFLIEAFEAEVEEAENDEEEEEESHEPAAPHETLRRLLEARGLELTDIADVFGNPHLAREAVEGHRTISRNQAKQLSRYFGVPAKLFQD